MKMPYYPYFSTLKFDLRVKIQKFFLVRFRSLRFLKLTPMFIQGAPAKHLKFLNV